MKKDMKKIFALVLVLVMLLSMVPSSAMSNNYSRNDIKSTSVNNDEINIKNITDGAILTDKIVKDNGDGSFDITLKAIGQDYQVKESVSPVPVDVVFVLDISTSMAGDKVKSMKAAAINAAKIIVADKNSTNRVAVIAYGEEASTKIGFTSKLKDFNSAINGLDIYYNIGTNIQDGIYEAQNLILGRSSTEKNKPIIILMSDGRPTYYYNTFTDLKYSNRQGTGNPDDTNWTYVGQTIEQAALAKRNISNLDIYTIGFGVGNDEYAKATLMPDKDNTLAYRTAYAVQSREATESGSVQYYRDKNWYWDWGWKYTWSSWTLAKPVKTETNTNISSGAWTDYGVSSVPTAPSDTWGSWPASQNDAASHGKIKESNGGDRQSAYFDNVSRQGVQYQISGTKVSDFTQGYWSEGSTLAGTSTEIANAFTAIAESITTFKPNTTTTNGSFSDITIKDVIGTGFELVGNPSGISVDGANLTWTIDGDTFKTRKDGDTSAIKDTDITSITFTVKISDSTTAAGTYYTNASAEATFTVADGNPYFTGTSQKQELKNTGILVLEGYEPLSVQKAATLEGPETDRSSLFADDEFTFKIEKKVKVDGVETYVPFVGTYSVTPASDDARSTTATTNTDGTFTLMLGQKAVFTAIKDGTNYRITEDLSDKTGFLAPEWSKGGTIIDSDVIEGTFNLGGEEGDYSYVCTNGIETADVTFDKIDAQTGYPLQGAEFRLTDIDGNKGSFNAESDEDGVVTFTDIPIGNYELEETDAPEGYNVDDTTYEVVVAEGDGDTYVYFYEPGSEARLETVTFENTPILNDLFVTKTVKGTNAPENQEEATQELYRFILTFDGDYEVTEDMITSDGAFDFAETKDEGDIEIARISKDSETTSYEFYLVKDGWIKIKVREGVRYTLEEEWTPDYRTTYKLVSGFNDDDAIDGGVYAEMHATTAAITVQNHYGNDGLTIEKSVTGSLAPDRAETSYGFTATFWTSEDEKTMMGALDEEAEKAIGDAQEEVTTLAAILGDKLGELEAAQDLVEAATTSQAALKDAMDDKKAELDAAQVELRIAVIDKELESKTAELLALDPMTDQLDIIVLEVEIEELKEEKDGLGNLVVVKSIAEMETLVAQLEGEYQTAKQASEDADAELTAAQGDLDELKADADVQAYLAAQEKLEALQDEYDSSNDDENILERIWAKFVNFFKGLFVGEVGSGSDIEYSSTDGVDLDYSEATSQSAFSLKDGEEIVFDFDNFFAESEGETIYFEITEVDDQDAKSTTISSVGLDDIDQDRAARLIKGTINAETGDPIITYTNDFGNPEPKYTLTVTHKAGNTLLFEEQLSAEEGDKISSDPITRDGYKFSTVSAIDVKEFASDSDGNVTGEMPDKDASITFIYTKVTDDNEEEDNNDDNEKHKGSDATTVIDEETPASPVTPPAVTTPEQSVIEDAIPAAPLPKTGGVAPYLIYGLGLLLAGGGLAVRKKEDKNK